MASTPSVVTSTKNVMEGVNPFVALFTLLSGARSYFVADSFWAALVASALVVLIAYI